MPRHIKKTDVDDPRGTVPLSTKVSVDCRLTLERAADFYQLSMREAIELAVTHLAERMPEPPGPAA